MQIDWASGIWNAHSAKNTKTGIFQFHVAATKLNYFTIIEGIANRYCQCTARRVEDMRLNTEEEGAVNENVTMIMKTENKLFRC